MDITQKVNSKIRLIIFFAAKDGEALYSLIMCVEHIISDMQ